MDSQAILRVDGAVERPLSLTFGDLHAMPEGDHVLDISRFHPGRKGDGVTLESLLARAKPTAEANYMTLHASRDDFHVSVPLGPVREQGVVVYRLAGGHLTIEEGGPIRFLVRDPAVCNTGELDECANVKYLSRIELTTRRGTDTRPTTEDVHAALNPN